MEANTSPPQAKRPKVDATVGLGVAILILLTTVSACTTFDTRSDLFACMATAECDAPRICESGHCVIPGDVLQPDADPLQPDADPLLPDADLSQPDATPVCSSIDLVDDFADGTATPAWVAVTDPEIALSESGGVLTITSSVLPQSNVEAGYTSVRSDFVFTNSSFMIEIPTMVAADSKAVATVVIGSGVDSQIILQQKMGTFSVFLSVNAGNPKTVASLPYDATAHRWWRVIDSGGTFQVQTSPNGTQWTTQGSDVTPAFFAAVGIDLRVRAFSTGNVAGSLVFDNANGGGVVDACPAP